MVVTHVSSRSPMNMMEELQSFLTGNHSLQPECIGILIKFESGGEGCLPEQDAIYDGQRDICLAYSCTFSGSPSTSSGVPPRKRRGP
jgi:hypothetical protein